MRPTAHGRWHARHLVPFLTVALAIVFVVVTVWAKTPAAAMQPAVGQTFGLTRERIRQIEKKTLAELESYRDAEGLRDFLD